MLADTALDAAISAVGMQCLKDLETHAAPIHSNLAARFLIVPPPLVGLACRLARHMSLADGRDLIVLQESRLSTLGLVNPQTDTFISNSSGGTNWLLCAPFGEQAKHRDWRIEWLPNPDGSPLRLGRGPVGHRA